jgi:hypothetical protein
MSQKINLLIHAAELRDAMDFIHDLETKRLFGLVPSLEQGFALSWMASHLYGGGCSLKNIDSLSPATQDFLKYIYARI